MCRRTDNKDSRPLIFPSGSGRRWHLLVLVGVGTAVGLGLWLLANMRVRSADSLRDQDLCDLQSSLGIAFPDSTRSIQTFVEDEEDTMLNVYLRVDFDACEAEGSNAWLRLMVDAESDPNQQTSAHHDRCSIPAWLDATPVRKGDVLFSKRFSSARRVSTIMYGLLRVEAKSATLYFGGLVDRMLVPPDLVRALEKYPAGYTTVVGPVGVVAEREWTGERLPPAVVDARAKLPPRKAPLR